MTPMGSGDYGQWLMTSRYYLGESVPAYRALAEVPPLVPAVLARIRSIVPDPIVAIHVLATVLLVGLGTSLAALGTLALRSRWAGALAVVAGLLVTDRFTDLFAFGGLLQVAAVTLLIVAMAGFARAAVPGAAMRWWWMGVGALAATALTHVGTGVIGVPAGATVAVLAAVAWLAGSSGDLRTAVERLRWPAAALSVIGLYWAAVLVPASGEYVTNPASLAYRGPDRLVSDLFSRWPTTLVVIVGAISLGFGTLRALGLRRIDGHVLLAAWATVTWGALAFSILRGSATDYPRFATPLLAPLVVGAAGGALWLLRSFAATVADLGWRQPANVVVAMAVVGSVLVAAPLTIQRHMRQAGFYALRDATSLEAAAAWIDGQLGPRQSVLAEVRDAKWVEVSRAGPRSSASRCATRSGRRNGSAAPMPMPSCARPGR
jgi:hypothetical protein